MPHPLCSPEGGGGGGGREGGGEWREIQVHTGKNRASLIGLIIVL